LRAILGCYRARLNTSEIIKPLLKEQVLVHVSSSLVRDLLEIRNENIAE
jgi:hypothetical protein